MYVSIFYNDINYENDFTRLTRPTPEIKWIVIYKYDVNLY